MGQVPRYGIVGDGRVARHFRHYLDLLGIPARHWSRRQEERSGISVEDELATCELVLILIGDGAIIPFVEAHPDLREKRLIHFSGALATPLATGFHPLMTFGEELYELAVYREIPFVGEEGQPGFSVLMPELPNPSHAIPAELKPLYHSLCVMSGNFTVLLWQKFFTELESTFGISRSIAQPFLRQVLKNLESNPSTALTGPIQRRDRSTIQSNLKALEQDSFQGVYRSFVRAISPEVLQ